MAIYPSNADPELLRRASQLEPRRQAGQTERLAMLEKRWGNRLRPGFTGETGLLSNDAQGWSNMLNAQTEAENLRRELGGIGPLAVEGQMRPMPSTRGYGPTTVWQPGQTSLDYGEITEDDFEPASPALSGIRRATAPPRGRAR